MGETKGGAAERFFPATCCLQPASCFGIPHYNDPMRKIEDLYNDQDIKGLARELRRKEQPELRARAARALGQLGELGASDVLAGAALYDPDLEVQKAAKMALQELLGSQADMILRMAAADDAPDEPWLISENESAAGQFQDAYFADGEGEVDSSVYLQAEPTARVDPDTIHGLATLAGHGSTRKELRLKAIQSLADISDMNAIRVLGQLVLFAEEEEIRSAAESALKGILGDNLEEYLDGLRLEVTGEETDELEEDEDQPETFASPYAQTSASQPSTIQEEGTPARLWIILILAAAGGLVWFFFFR